MIEYYPKNTSKEVEEGLAINTSKDLDLKVELVKVPAHSDDALNIQADNLAKAMYTNLQPTFLPLALHYALCTQ
ncbi:hypothetical protein RhiirC2_777281 [Rhizophagus irregularis]|uniref:RNase H type-1 domain-containing protein n=1 Tax=Rhizophagus irregularis TaxID=588596 RepID=A0A2N1NEW4_9GLOM|nr:hypothetical protein RhiirC2_777281 [Rhizophagus irregularis]